jgi:hypothetical protein
MLCYRDRIFCTFFEGCRDKNTCSRPLTEAVQKSARDWWGGEGVPIATFSDRPSCFRLGGRVDGQDTEWIGAYRSDQKKRKR